MRQLTSLMLLALALGAAQLNAQVATEWVHTRDAGATNVIALGYPVPIPVDTPLPFDGFRTYAGLHSRHLDLTDTTPWVHPEDIGITRYGRTIPAYRLGDADLLTIDGLPEPASLVNGGIHAREWQSPEVVTGLMELMALHEEDAHFYDYLRDNVNMVVIPVLNVDGFLQTQRYPTLSYMQSDPDYPDYSPRDGRMRRKNMLSADEDFYTTFDHLNGVDLNRNNAPFWAWNPERSSPNLNSIVHHGSSPASEPEIQALDAAAHLGPIERLRIYTDAHSFSQVHFWSINENSRLSLQTDAVLRLFTNHHWAFPSGKYYSFQPYTQKTHGHGIGVTAEYFTYTYQVPSWTLEIEPRDGGVDYGGVGENGHDGFILPESEIRRVREQLAQSFAAVYYRQAGPPSIQSLRVIEPVTQAVVFEADWDVRDSFTRSLFTQQLRPLQFDYDYELWMSFNKPMRWREDGQATSMPGVSPTAMYFYLDALVGETIMTTNVGEPEWLDAPGRAPDGYANYVYDAVRVGFNMPADELNLGLVGDVSDSTLKVLTLDMARMRLDANPASVVDWANGAWTGYENASGFESDSGGDDTTISLQVSSQPVEPPFVLEPGITASWYDPSRDGEGFLIELLEDSR
ncbi:MAG: M14 family zinc carboxypeptidase, partial [Lysobacterales bacterium]